MQFLKDRMLELVTGLVALVGLINTFFGLNLQVDPDYITGVLFAIVPILVFFFPKKFPADQVETKEEDNA